MSLTFCSTNVRRSGKTSEYLTMNVAWQTPLSKLDELVNYMNDWLETEPNRWFEPSTTLIIEKIDHQRTITCAMMIGHNG